MRSIRRKGRNPRRTTVLPLVFLCALLLFAVVPAMADAATIATTASNADIGSPIHDTATISDALLPSGTVTFDVYAAGDSNCLNAPVASFDVVVDLGGSATSPDYLPPVAGLYQWIASYHDDPLNPDPLAGNCGDPGETSTVAKVTPTLSTSASDATVGGSIHDTATISGGHNPGGTVTFEAVRSRRCNLLEPVG